MRKYECFFILHPELSDEATTEVENKLRTVVESEEGIVLRYEPWGKRKLAYPIKKNTYGSYVLMEFAAPPQLVKELERNLRIDERILRFITVKLEDKFSPEEEKNKAEEEISGKGAEEESPGIPPSDESGGENEDKVE